MTDRWEKQSSDYYSSSNGIIFASNQDYYYGLGYGNSANVNSVSPMIALVNSLTGAV